MPRFELFKFDTDVDDLVQTLDDDIYSGTLLVEMLYNRVSVSLSGNRLTYFPKYTIKYNTGLFNLRLWIKFQNVPLLQSVIIVGHISSFFTIENI